MRQTRQRLSCALAALLVTLPFASAQLQLTGLVHGPISGAPKAVELFTTADIEDLSIYGLGTANNGTGSAGEEWSFPAIPLPANSFIYVSKEQPTFTSFFGFPPDFVDDGAACNFNGDDAVELFANGIAVDRYGDPNLDGTGEDWEYTLGWAFRDCADDGGLLFNPAFWSALPGAMSGINANAESDSPWPLGEFALPCAPVIEGCTEPHADNYNPWATADDGSCDHTAFFAATGCTYALAANFDPDALLDDGSCQDFDALSHCPEESPTSTVPLMWAICWLCWAPSVRLVVGSSPFQAMTCMYRPLACPFTTASRRMRSNPLMWCSFFMGTPEMQRTTGMIGRVWRRPSGWLSWRQNSVRRIFLAAWATCKAAWWTRMAMSCP